MPEVPYDYSPIVERALDQALEYIANHPGVWPTTADEIAEHYARA